MRQSRIDYGRLVEGALRGVVRDVLTRAGREGLPAPHHFYVTFRTQHPGVDIPAFLRERYPADMTIVLQHQFWDLDVTEDGFAVTLSFGDQPYRLKVPFLALKVFADPGVEFGLQFTLESDEAPAPAAEGEGATLRLLPGPGGERAEDGEAASRPVPEGGAEIVTLDRFRKK